MSNRILSYRAKIAHDAQDTILLTTKKGEVGYRITKFQVFPEDPGTQHYEHTIKIYKEEQSSVTNTVDFSDNRLLGAAYFQDDNAKHYPSSVSVVFDQEIFNQDIYVTCIGTDGATVPMNYYIELEIIKLDESQAMVATLKDIRNNS